MNTVERISIVLMVLAFASGSLWAQSAGDYKTVANGNWNTTATWNRYSGSAWVAATSTPTSADGVITIGHSVTVTADVAVDQVACNSGSSLTINSGATLTVEDGSGTDLEETNTAITANGSLTLNSGASLVGGGGNTSTNGSLVVGSSGTATIDGTIGRGTQAVSIFVTVNAGGTIDISGSLALYRGNGGDVFTVSGAALLSGSGNVDIGGAGYMTVISSATVQLEPNATISGNRFTLSSGGNLKIGSTAGITTAGTATGNVLTSTRTFNIGANYTYNGTAAQVTGTGLPATVNNLTIANGSGVTLTNNVTVGGTLSLATGALTTGANKVTVSNTAAGAVTNAGGNISGTIQRAMSGTGTFLFNDANTSLTPGSAITATLSFACTPGSGPSNKDAALYYVDRTYVITVVSGAPPSSTLRLSYADGELAGSLESALDLYRYSGSGTTWTGVSSTRNESANWVEATGVSTFSTWGIASDQPLPIQLASFTSSVIEAGAIRLDWHTVSEINNYGFYIERRADNETDFTELANVFIPGHGTTLEPQSYSYTDNSATPGVWYYRLRQVDLDGSVNYTDAVRVDLVVTGVTENAPKEFALYQNYPNPFNPTTAVSWQLSAVSNVKLVIYDLLGREVAVLVNETMQPGTYHRTFDASGLSSGVYVYRLQASEKSAMKRMVLVR